MLLTNWQKNDIQWTLAKHIYTELIVNKHYTTSTYTFPDRLVLHHLLVYTAAQTVVTLCKLEISNYQNSSNLVFNYYMNTSVC